MGVILSNARQSCIASVSERVSTLKCSIAGEPTPSMKKESVSCRALRSFKYLSLLEAMKMLPSSVGKFGSATYSQRLQLLEIVTDHGEALGCQIIAPEVQVFEISQVH